MSLNYDNTSICIIELLLRGGAETPLLFGYLRVGAFGRNTLKI